MSDFKHKVGSIIETTAGTLGKVVSAKTVYEIAFSKDDIQSVNDDAIITEPIVKRTRRKKEETAK